MSKYGLAITTTNTNDLYEELFEERGVKHITHYKTPRWPPLTVDVRTNFVTSKHVWRLGDRYWKLASQYYGDPKLWWAIAWYNQRPTEAGISQGDVVLIPNPIERVVSYFEYGSF